jgi:hypothetical protein
MTRSFDHVPAFTRAQRRELIEVADERIARRFLRELAWQRLSIWKRYLAAAGALILGTMTWGEQVLAHFRGLLHALGW